MTNQIVVIQISVTQAPAPITLQATGAFISQGGTSLTPGTYSLLTQTSDLTPLLASPLSLVSLTWSGGTVLAAVTGTIPGLSPGDTFVTTIAGVSPAGYNGTFLATATGASTFTYSLPTNPGTETAPGTYSPPSQGELIAMTGTFFGQGGAQSVYVLELGAGNGSSGPTALSAWITTNPGIFYSYLVPRIWDAKPNFLALVAQFEALNAKTYFFTTTTISTYTAYNAQMKSVIALVEAPGIALTEFSMAAPYQHSLNYAPSTSNRMTPFAFSFLFGVTSYPTVGNNALLATLKAANINYVGTGAEGGLSTAILLWGKNLDGNDFSYWYSVDWIQLNSDQAISNAVINGSNDPLNPLYYNQNGINLLQDTVVQTVQNAITFGLANGTTGRTALNAITFQENFEEGDYADQNVCNAVPFLLYTQQNVSAYKTGVYGGLSLVYIPQRGFTQIIFLIQVSQFITP